MPDQKQAANEHFSFGQELMRKATHMGALIIPGGYFFLNLDRLNMLLIMIPITIAMIIIDISRLRQWLFWRKFASKIITPLIRKHEIDGDFTGATYILLSVCLTVALFSKPIAIAALCFIIVGDTMAAIVGYRFGRHKIWRGKSIEGSLACLAGSVIVAVFLPDLSWAVKISGAALATVIEAIPFGIDDNVTVPILSGLGMTILNQSLMNF